MIHLQLETAELSLDEKWAHMKDPSHASQITAAPFELSINQKQWEHFVKDDDHLKLAHVLDEDKIMDIVRACHEEDKEEVDDDADE